MADFSLGSLLFLLFSLCVTREELSKLSNLTRWFTTLVLQNETVSVFGNFKWCTKKLEPEFKESEKKEVKDNKEQGKKDNKEKGKKDNKKNNEEENQKNKDDAKAEKERKQKEKELELEKEEAEHKRKVKEWIELPGQFDFETFKRIYSNSEKGHYDEAIK